MSQASSIEWTDATWNPVRGCSRVSEGCRNCYAERVAARFSRDIDAIPGPSVGQRSEPFAGFAEQTKAGPRWTGRVELIPSKLDEPLRWKKPRRIFVNSMSDLFHERLSDEEIAAVFGVMAACPQHTFQILTKRPERMRRWFEWAEDQGEELKAVTGETPPPGTGAPASACVMHAGDRFTGGVLGEDDWRRGMHAAWPLPNIWLGTSVEDQATADERISLLLQTPAAVRFVSYEPALGPVDFGRFILPIPSPDREDPIVGHVGLLHWLIVGGESGPGARPFDVAWARSAVAQCKAAGVPVFVKQLGARPEYDQGCGDCDPCLGGGPCCVGGVRLRLILRDRKGGDPSEWPEDLRVRKFPESRRREA